MYEQSTPGTNSEQAALAAKPASNGSAAAAAHPDPVFSEFVQRHIGPDSAEQQAMLQALGYDTLTSLIDAAVPANIQLQRALKLTAGTPEAAALKQLKQIAEQNQVWRSYIGLGYANTLTPAVIQRNILENPGWYTQYTPYQPEISQGRLEALLNFQTLITDLTDLEIANASLLDEG
ncbi:MAG: glycine dehydrogenase (aminomethyl-transferring), partial [Cyanobacteria bacterium Co-bin13]|nr:glycine dehydrogenase (aminomethyl-transferring) [Cyanobacteria bacterium Co-bin13]